MGCLVGLIDQAIAWLECHVVSNPLGDEAKAMAEADQKADVYSAPEQPGPETGHMHRSELRDSLGPPDGGQGASIDITKGRPLA